MVIGRGRGVKRTLDFRGETKQLLAGCWLRFPELTRTCRDVGVKCREFQDSQTVSSESEAVRASCLGGNLLRQERKRAGMRAVISKAL